MKDSTKRVVAIGLLAVITIWAIWLASQIAVASMDTTVEAESGNALHTKVPGIRVFDLKWEGDRPQLEELGYFAQSRAVLAMPDYTFLLINGPDEKVPAAVYQIRQSDGVVTLAPASVIEANRLSMKVMDHRDLLIIPAM